MTGVRPTGGPKITSQPPDLPRVQIEARRRCAPRHAACRTSAEVRRLRRAQETLPRLVLPDCRLIRRRCCACPACSPGRPSSAQAGTETEILAWCSAPRRSEGARLRPMRACLGTRPELVRRLHWFRRAARRPRGLIVIDTPRAVTSGRWATRATTRRRSTRSRARACFSRARCRSARSPRRAWSR